jgi:hypothetical protein
VSEGDVGGQMDELGFGQGWLRLRLGAKGCGSARLSVRTPASPRTSSR